MRKILISAGLLLLPFLAFSYELDLEYTNFAKQLQYDLKETIQGQQLSDFPDDYYVDKITAIIENSIRLFEDKIIFKRYYKTDIIKTSLQKQKLMDILKNNEQVSHQVARYIVNHNPHTNDFEALLAIGVNPIEAAVRLNNEEYIQSALETGTITYPHPYIVTTIYMDESRVVSNGCTSPTIIQVNTSQEEIEEIKSKIQRQEELRKKSRPLRKWWSNLNYFHW